MAYTLKWMHRSVHCYFEDAVTKADFTGAVKKIVGNERFDNLLAIVADCKNVSAVEEADRLATQGIAELLGAYNYNKRVKIAVIAKNEAIKRLVQTAIESEHFLHDIKLFDERIDAFVWLDYIA